VEGGGYSIQTSGAKGSRQTMAEGQYTNVKRNLNPRLEEEEAENHQYAH
jgi:hypothetical protein